MGPTPNQLEKLREDVGNDARGRFPEATELFSKLSLAPEVEEFLTVPAYGKLG